MPSIPHCLGFDLEDRFFVCAFSVVATVCCTASVAFWAAAKAAEDDKSLHGCYQSGWSSPELSTSPCQMQRGRCSVFAVTGNISSILNRYCEPPQYSELSGLPTCATSRFTLSSVNSVLRRSTFDTRKAHTSSPSSGRTLWQNPNVVDKIPRRRM